MDQTYLLTIITVTYNAENEVRKTLESLVSQNIMSGMIIEYIVQDGCSKDNTLKIVREYRERLLCKGIDLAIKCEKDNGIYDAMNKGIENSHGKWICLLNAGDRFYDENVLCGIKDSLIESTSDILYGDYRRVNSYLSRKVEIPPVRNLEKMMIFCHQAIFIRDYVYRKYNYDIQYKLVADYDLMLRLYLGGFDFEHIPVCLIDYDTEGVSGKNMIDTYREIYKVRKEHYTIDNNLHENFIFVVGLVKRIILANMPQKFRWYIYKKLKH